jgi:hypothetical protein
MKANSKSPHILNTSANLFGLCFVVFSTLKALHLRKETIIDEFTAISMLMFMISCTTSFLSVRSTTSRSLVYERIADYVFMAGLFTLFLTTTLIVFNVIQ